MADRFIQDINIPRLTIRETLMGNDFLTQLAKITDSDGQLLLNKPAWKGVTKAGEGFNVEYPTARIAFVDREYEYLPDGFPKNCLGTLIVELIFRFSARDEDDVDINIGGEVYSLATYVGQWLEPDYSDNPNGWTPQYPNIWRWDSERRGKQNLNRNLIKIDKSITGMSGSLYATHLYLPIRVFSPTVPWPIP